MKFRAWCLLSLSWAACAVEPGGSGDDPELYVPDGTPGVDQVIRHGEVQAIPWIARHGLKYVSDDFAIGVALAKTPEIATPDAMGEWPGNIVPYCALSFDNDHNNGLQDPAKAQLAGYLSDLEAITPLKFQVFDCAATTKPARYVDFQYWDVTTGNETIGGVGHDGWTIQLVHGFHGGDVWHETGHAVGFMHEQQRADRDQFVNFYSTCVTPHDANTLGNFAQITGATELSPYDVTSIMEYGSWSFGIQDDHGNVTCPPLLFGGADPANAPIWGHSGRTTLRGTWISPSGAWTGEDINGAWQWYEPKIGAAETNDRFGTAMVSGDFDGDGYDDLAVGAIGEQVSSFHGGAVLLYKGTMSGLVAWKVLDENDFLFVSTHTTDDFGMALAAGDVDGDGITDLVVGAPLYGTPMGGAVFIYKGGRGGPTPLVGPITTSTLGAGAMAYGDFFGQALAVGKLYGGTTSYVAVGAPWQTPAGAPASHGEVVTFSVASGAAHLQEVLHPEQANVAVNSGMFGYALAAGDLNADGIDDLVVGAPAISVGTGNAVPFYGHATNLTPGTKLVPSNAPLATGDRFGYALGYGKDSTGQPMLAVGAPGRGGAGAVYTFMPILGTIVMVDAHQQAELAGQVGQSGDNFGAAVAVGDIAGDLNLDLVVGVPGRSVGGNPGAGEAVVFTRNGTPRVITAQTLHASDGFAQDLAIGNFDRGAQSVVGDTHPDLAIGIPNRAVGTQTGAGAFNTYKGTAQALWRQFTENTHNGP